MIILCPIDNKKEDNWFDNTINDLKKQLSDDLKDLGDLKLNYKSHYGVQHRPMIGSKINWDLEMRRIHNNKKS